MLQSGDEMDLPLEPLRAEAPGELRVEDLEGNRTVVLQVAGEEDRGHPPAPELPLEHIAILQRGRQGGGRCGQMSPEKRGMVQSAGRQDAAPDERPRGGTVPPRGMRPVIG